MISQNKVIYIVHTKLITSAVRAVCQIPEGMLMRFHDYVNFVVETGTYEHTYTYEVFIHKNNAHNNMLHIISFPLT